MYSHNNGKEVSMRVLAVFDSIDQLRVDAVCTRLPVELGGYLKSFWQEISANRQIMAAAGPYYNNQLVGQNMRLSIRPCLLVRGTRSQHHGAFDHVIFHINGSGDDMSVLDWISTAEQSGCHSIAVPINPLPYPWEGWPGVDKQEWVKEQATQLTVSVYQRLQGCMTNGTLQTIYVAFDPIFLPFRGHIEQMWKTCIARLGGI